MQIEKILDTIRRWKDEDSGRSVIVISQDLKSDSPSSIKGLIYGNDEEVVSMLTRLLKNDETFFDTIYEAVCQIRNDLAKNKKSQKNIN